jgi:NADPH:quinone reductase-like Zn-dependent oxidoreductase
MPHSIPIRQPGGPEILNWTPFEIGEPGSGQVRLRQAVGLNYIDVYHRTRAVSVLALQVIDSPVYLSIVFNQGHARSELFQPMTQRTRK